MKRNLRLLPVLVPPLQMACSLAVVLSVAVAARAQSVSPASSPGSSPAVYEGFTQAKHDILVSGPEMGRLVEVLVEMGDRVQAGEVVAQMDHQLQQSSVRVARAQAQMIGEVEAARAERDQHQRRTEKLRKLASNGMARPDELARAETDLRIAQGRLTTAEEQRQLRKLQLEQHEIQLQRRQITASKAGVIAKVLHEPGEYISPADPAVVRLMVTDSLHAIFNVPAEKTDVFQIGRTAEVFLRSSARTIQAPIDSVSPAIDGESGTVRVRVTLPNPKGELWVGDRCTLRLAGRGSRRISAGPESAGPESRQSGGLPR